MSVGFLSAMTGCTQVAKGPLSKDEAAPIDCLNAAIGYQPVSSPLDQDSPPLKPIIEWEIDGDNFIIGDYTEVIVDNKGGILFFSTVEPNNQTFFGTGRNMFYELIRVNPAGRLDWVHRITNDLDESPTADFLGLTQNSILVLHNMHKADGLQNNEDSRYDHLCLIECIDLDGNQRWITNQFPPGTLGYRFSHAPGNTFLVLHDDLTIYQHSLLDGSLLHEIPPGSFDGSLLRSSVIQDGSDYIRTIYGPDATVYTTYKTDVNGNLIWSDETTSPSWDYILVNGQYIGGSPHGLVSKSPENWDTKWIYEEPMYVSLLAVTPDNKLVIYCNYGSYTAGDLAVVDSDGNEIWRKPYHRSDGLAPDVFVYRDNGLLVVDRNGVVCMESDGTERWKLDRTEFNTPIYPPPPDINHTFQASSPPDNSIIVFLKYPDMAQKKFIQRIIKLSQP